MSLLSGIQFVPKSKREISTSSRDDERPKKQSKREKKEAKREKKERKRDRKINRDSSDDDDDDDDDDNVLGAEEMQRLAEQSAPAKPQQPTFADLLSKASSGNGAAIEAPSSSSSSSATSAAPPPPASNNQRMADLLRARLKGGPGAMSAPAFASSSSSQQQQQQVEIMIPDKQYLIHAKLANANANAGGKNSALAGLSAAQRLKLAAKGGEEDMDEVYRNNILRLGEKYVGGELGGTGKRANRGGEDEEDEDINMDMFTGPTKEGVNEKRQLERQVQAAQRLQAAHERCELCQGSSTFRPNLIVHTGSCASLRLLPAHLQLLPGHCEISPHAHSLSMLQAYADDAVLDEVRLLKRALRKMFEGQGQGVVFLESAIHFKRQPHCRIVVLPIPRGSEGEATMMFREALQDMNGLFAQHGKLIDITRDRPLTRAIPPNFPYLHAELAEGDKGSDRTGVAHVVDLDEDNEKGVNSNYLLDVVAGLVDEEPLGMRRKLDKGFREDQRATARSVDDFRRHFDKHFY